MKYVCMFLFAFVCYRMLSLLTVFPCRYRDSDCNRELIPELFVFKCSDNVAL